MTNGGPARAMRVMVVDDEPAAAEGLRVLLELDGYEVVALQSSERALELLATEDFDAVVTDLEMPVVHGVEVVRAARAARAAMPIVVITAYTQSPASVAALRAGARRVLDKPLDYDELSAELKRTIRGGAAS